MPALVAGASSAPDGKPTGSAVADPGQAFSAADVEFLGTMLPHHAQAVRMAELAASRATDGRVRELAEADRAALVPEITQMTRWLAALGIDPADLGEHIHAGRTSEQDLADLAALSGPEFDARYLDLRLDHDVAAAAIGRVEANDGRQTDVRRLAGAITRRDGDDMAAVHALQ